MLADRTKDWIDRLAALAEVRRDEPMAKHTSYRVGGPADAYVIVRSADDLRCVIQFARAEAIPYRLIGRGSNMLVADRGIRGIVVENQARHFRIEQVPDGGIVFAESGVSLPLLAQHAGKAGLTGLEWAVAIPGTVGGGVEMNAGAHGGCIADVLERTAVLGVDNVVHEYTLVDLDYGYRTSRFRRNLDTTKERDVVLWARFRLRVDQPDVVRDRIEQLVGRRKATQPALPSAGSVFKNPPGDSAGRLIEQAGLKGATIGGARISEKHANFIVNVRGASAADVRGLMELAQRTVAERFGIHLELEQELVGDWS